MTSQNAEYFKTRGVFNGRSWLDEDLFLQVDTKRVLAVSIEKVMDFWQLAERWPGMTKTLFLLLSTNKILPIWHPVSLDNGIFHLLPINEQCWRDQTKRREDREKTERLARAADQRFAGSPYFPFSDNLPLLAILPDIEKLEKEHPELLTGDFPDFLFARQQGSSDPGLTSGSPAADQGKGQPDTASFQPYRRTVKAERWQQSLETALSVCLEIVQGEKTDWKRPEFEDEFYRRYFDVLTEAIDIAWRKLPEKFKKGPGRARVTEENPDKLK